jgi:hypothetical protein
MTFFINFASFKSITVQVGNYYLNIPNNFYATRNMNIILPDNSVLNVKVSYDSTTYEGRTVWKVELSHPTLTIFDAVIIY